jgi:hypothetical protein
MKTLLVLALSLLAFAAPARAQYNRPDAGWLVFSAGSIKRPMNFTFFYRKIGEESGLLGNTGGTIENSQSGLFAGDPDYAGREKGRVTVRRMEPGNYEIYRFSFLGTLTVDGAPWPATREFSLPFTITPGRATYIGDFARAPSLGTPLGKRLGASGFFVISDKHDRDIAIARKHEPALPPVTVSVPDVSTLGPELQAQEPQ